VERIRERESAAVGECRERLEGFGGEHSYFEGMGPGDVGHRRSLRGPVLPIHAAETAAVVRKVGGRVSDGYPVAVPRTRPLPDGVGVEIVRRCLEEELVGGRVSPRGLRQTLGRATVHAAGERLGRLPCTGAAVECPVVVLAFVPL